MLIKDEYKALVELQKTSQSLDDNGKGVHNKCLKKQPFDQAYSLDFPKLCHFLPKSFTSIIISLSFFQNSSLNSFISLSHTLSFSFTLTLTLLLYFLSSLRLSLPLLNLPIKVDIYYLCLSSSIDSKLSFAPSYWLYLTLFPFSCAITELTYFHRCFVFNLTYSKLCLLLLLLLLILASCCLLYCLLCFCLEKVNLHLKAKDDRNGNEDQ